MTKDAFDRRTFLKTSTALSAALLLGTQRLARAGALDGKKVVVIGAGCAGLGAARTLADSGADVTVLEAKPHIGGRLLTDWSMGAPFEVGAGWIHGPEQANPTKQLADAVGAEYVVTDDDNLVVFDRDGEEISEDMLEEIGDDWWAAVERMDNELENHDNRSLADIVSGDLRDDGLNWAWSAYTEFSKGGPVKNLSAVLFDDDDAFDTPDVVVTTGYDALLKPLAEGLNIKLSTVVSNIQYSTDGAVVKTSAGDFEADYVVCSVSLGVLKAGNINFAPPLPSSYQRAIDKVGFGSVTKIAFKFDQAFWDVETQYFGAMTAPKGRWNYWVNYRTFSDENIILGLSVGSYAITADQMSEAEAKADALDVLRNIWGDAVTEPTQMLRTTWYTDPHTLGAYAYPTPGASASMYDRLGEPVEDRLMLCGEHTIFDYAGTTHGAYITGLRAAEHILDSV